MNTAFFDYCIKSLKRRKKQVLKAVMAIFLSFTFVAGVLLFGIICMNGRYSQQNTGLATGLL